MKPEIQEAVWKLYDSLGGALVSLRLTVEEPHDKPTYYEINFFDNKNMQAAREGNCFSYYER